MKLSIDITCLWLLVAVIAVLVPTVVFGRAVSTDILSPEEELLDRGRVEDAENSDTGFTDREIFQLIRLVDMYLEEEKHLKSRRMSSASLWGRPLEPLGNGLTGYANWGGKRSMAAEKRSELYDNLTDEFLSKRGFEDIVKDALKSKRFGSNVMDSLDNGFRGHGIGSGKRR